MSGLTRRRFFSAASCLVGSSAIRGGAGQADQGTLARPSVTIAVADYVRYMPFSTGEIRATDMALTVLRGDRSEMLRRATSDPSIHGGETSMAQHVVRLDRGDRSLVAIPVFPLRNFTARDFYTRRGSTLTLERLDGQRVGIYNWVASGAVWYRHLVRHFGRNPADVKWIVGSPDQRTPVTVNSPLPASVTLARSGSSLSDMLLAGEMDAFFAPLPPRQFHPLDGPIVRVVRDFRKVEQQYFARTKCYPPQHVLVFRREVWETDPSIGRKVLDAFDRCERSFQASQRLYPYSTPWQIADLEEAERVIGPDFHGHGLERNRHAVEVFCQGAFDDGLTKRRLAVDEFFAEFLKAS